MDLMRGTTESLIIDIPEDIDLEHAKEIWVTFTQNSKVIAEKRLSDSSLEIQVDAEGQIIFFDLPQEETLAFKTFIKTYCGIRILMEDDSAFASVPVPFTIIDINRGGVIE